MMRPLMAALGAAVLSTPPAVAADIDVGRQRATQCSSCHGVNGRSPVPNYPNLAGQNALYIQYALELYREEARTGGLAGLMHVQAAPLTDEDIANLAAYFGSLD